MNPKTIHFPTLVYKGKGPYSRAGGTYDYAPANDQQEFDEKLASGWFETLPESIQSNDNPTEQAGENAPPTRIELIEKAKELGLTFTKRTSDDNMLAMITEALNKQEA